jgi:hypothetical protein
MCEITLNQGLARLMYFVDVKEEIVAYCIDLLASQLIVSLAEL